MGTNGPQFRAWLLCTAALGMGMLGDTNAQAQTAVQAWSQRYNGPAESEDRAQKAVVYSSGDVIVAGYSNDGITGNDWLIIKYSGAGVPLWTNRYNGPGTGNSIDVANAVAVDGSGNVFVTGTSTGSSGFSDYTTIAYSSAGVGLWTNRSNGPLSTGAFASAVAVDGNGNVFVTGYWNSSGGNYDYATIAYSSAGMPLWTNRTGGSGDAAKAMAVDGGGNVFVTGSSRSSSGAYDYATIAYTSAGVALWTNRYNGSVNSSGATAVAVDGSGNVFVTGNSGSGDFSDYATIAYSSAGVPLWTNRYNGPANSEDVANGVAVDGNGNVFVTGYSRNSGSSIDYATIAYSGAGVALWTNRYNVPGNNGNYAFAVAVDGSGNVFVTGYSRGIGSSSDYVTIAYSSAGVPLWTNRYNGPANGDDVAHSVAVDGSGNVFVTGDSYGGSSFSASDYVTIKYSGAGVAVWTNRYNGTANSDDLAKAVAVDGSGNVFVTGDSARSWGSYDYLTLAYSSAGVPLWTNRYSGPSNSNDRVQAIAVDGNNDVVVTGSSGSSGGDADYATIAYSSAGVPLWTNRYDGPANSDDQAKAVAVDSSGNIFVTGSSVGIGSGLDFATIAYSSAGVPLWTNRYSGPGNSSDIANAVTLDGRGKVFVTGSSYGANLFSGSDYATIAYTSAGVPLWTNRYSGPENNDDNPYAMTVDSNGSVIVTGASRDTSGIYDYATIAYSSAGVPLWTNRYDGPENSTDIALAVAVNGSGDVFVTGYSYSSGGSYDYATIAYSSTGVSLWTNRYNGTGNGGDFASGVAVDSSDNVLVMGYSTGSSSSFDYATIAYSSAGVPLWTNRYNGPANGDEIPQTKQSLALGPDGSFYVTGASDGDYTSGTIYDFATVKYTVLPKRPELMIQRATPDAIRICWPTNATNYVLESKDQLSTSVSWTPVITPVGIEGSNFCITNRTDSSNARFYRLRLGN